MTALMHADNIMATRSGRWLMVCEPVPVVSMRKGPVTLQVGEKIRVAASTGSTIFAQTQRAESSMFGIEECHAFEAA